VEEAGKFRGKKRAQTSTKPLPLHEFLTLNCVDRNETQRISGVYASSPPRDLFTLRWVCANHNKSAVGFCVLARGVIFPSASMFKFPSQNKNKLKTESEEEAKCSLSIAFVWPFLHIRSGLFPRAFVCYFWQLS
jgi:hypothetical protein